MNVFRDHALWGERRIAFGIAACANHIEGAHRRFNARVDDLRSLKVRFAEIMSAIVASAATWSRNSNVDGMQRERNLKTVHKRAS
jgi:hypothetical protein